MSPRRSAAFRIDIRPQRRMQALVAALACLAAVAACAAFVSHLPWLWPSFLLAPVAAGWGWRAADLKPCRLQWDGERWWYSESLAQEADRPVQVQPVMDLGDWILLRMQLEPRGVWPTTRYLPLARSAAAESWILLRATLYTASSAKATQANKTEGP